MRVGLIALVVVIAAAIIAALQSFFIVNPTQQALVLQFGEVRQAVREPGLNTKIPFIQDTLYLDKRVLDLNVPAQEIIAADQKRLVVDAFMRYRIANPVRFYQAVNNVREGASRLSTFVQASLRAVLADATFTDIVRDDRPDLMQRIKADVAARARDIGVDVVDVKIRRADLPEANSEAIYARMQTEREQEAREIRAQGQEAAQRVRAAADRTATVLRAEAQREAEQIRGHGDGEKNAIFARAYTADPQFFAFYRAMQAYEEGLQSQDTRLVLSPDADFFRFFNDPLGAGEMFAGPRPRVGAAQPDGEGAGATTPDAAQTSSAPAAPPSGLDDPQFPTATEGAALDAPTATPASAERAVIEPEDDARAVVGEPAGDAAQTNAPTGAAAEDLRSARAGSSEPVEGFDSEPVVEDGPAVDPSVLSEEVDASPPAVTGVAEPDIEEDVEAVVDEGMAVDEASTAAAVTAAEPEPSTAANAAAAGVAGVTAEAPNIGDVERGNVTIVRPGDGEPSEIEATTVEVDQVEGDEFAVDPDEGAAVE